MVSQMDVSAGAKNLLVNCAQLTSDDSLIIVSEEERFGWYEDALTRVIFDEASKMGVKTKIIEVGEPKNKETEELRDLISNFDCALFLARIGDQNRFETREPPRKRVMCYARTVESLASKFGTIDHRALIDLKNAINSIFLNSRTIRVSCSNGSNLTGKMLVSEPFQNQDVNVFRFPMVVPMPILASSFSGNVVVSNYLTPTGSKVYSPNYLKLSDSLNVEIDKGRIINVHGHREAKKDFENHYDFVSQKFKLEKYYVHSWHAGIHPGIKYDQPIDINPDRWSNTMFASPKYLHFHTCGDYPPGEICWMLKNPTIEIDANALWDNGFLRVREFDSTKNCLEKWPQLSNLYTQISS